MASATRSFKQTQLNTLVDRDLASGIKLSTTSKLSFCEGCVEGKLQRKPFKPLTHKQSKRKLELVHSDHFKQNQSEVGTSSRLLMTTPGVSPFTLSSTRLKCLKSSSFLGNGDKGV